MERSLIDLLYDHAERNLPLEAVALLFGVREGDIVHVKRAELLTNVEASSTRFSVDPTEQYRLLIDAESRDEELICIFHSHPAPPRPSERDLRYMELNPVPWLIASRSTGTWQSRAYLFLDGEASEVQVVLD